uniref:Uncharacterized protein n=1 Tax=Anguilla anguilla TaxID=7936 RepID=A0A0E9T4Q2_ANGAN
MKQLLVRHQRHFTVLEHGLPLFPGADGVGAAHHRALGGDPQVFPVPRLQGYPGVRELDGGKTAPEDRGLHHLCEVRLQ